MFKRFTMVDVVCGLALLLLPWQARWIFGYHLLNGERYEYGVFGMYAASIILIAAVVMLVRQKQIPIRLGMPLWLLLGWLIFVVVAQVDYEVGWYSLMIAVVGFGYYVVGSSWKKEYVMQTIIISGVIQAFAAWYFFIAQSIPASTLLGVGEHMPATLGQSVVVIYGQRILRAYGLLSHPNILGGFLAIAFGIALHESMKFERGKVYFRPWKQWAAHLSVIIVLWSAILITFSRAAIVSVVFLLLGWLAYGTLMNEKNIVRSLSRASMYCLILFIAFNMVAQGIWMQRFGGVLSGSDHEQSRLEHISANERIVSYHQAAVLARPLHLVKGVGLGGFVPTLARAFPDLDVYRYQPTHNAFVLMVLEIGVIGALLYLWFFICLVRDTWRKHKGEVYRQYLFSLIALVAFMGFFDHFLWTQYIGQSLWWLVVGIAVNKGK